MIQDNDITKIINLNDNLQKVRSRLVKLYNEEFLINLAYRAVDKKSRYKPVLHKRISVGDLVLLKEDYTKPVNYPMGIIKNVTINDLGATTAVTIKMGNGEIVKRHITAVIPYLAVNEDYESVRSSLPQSNSNSRTFYLRSAKTK